MIPGPNGPVLTPKERRALIDKPFPQTRRIDPRHWGGVQTYPSGFEGSLKDQLQPPVRTGVADRVYGRRTFAGGEDD